MPARIRILLAILLALVALPIVVRALVLGAIGQRLRATAYGRGFDAGWRGLRWSGLDEVSLRGLTLADRASGDTLARADSLAVRVDPWSIARLHPTIARVSLAHARVTRRGPPAAPDTLADEDDTVAPASAERVRRLADAVARALLAPARNLPELHVRDLALATAEDEDSPVSSIQIAALDLERAGGGVRLAARGRLDLEREAPFAATLIWRRDDRLAGALTLGIPDTLTGRVDWLRLRVDGAVRQDRRGRRLVVDDGTRLTIGEVPLAVGGVIDGRGPRVTLHAEARDVTPRALLASLPPPVLGPLAEMRVRGAFDWRVALDLDVAHPDSVKLDAGATSRGLAIEPGSGGPDLLGLGTPFVASIHLPHGRIVTRDLSPANPYYRPLVTIDSTLVHAVLANEDGGFFRHRGFSLEAMRLAIAANLEAGAYRRGAGTVTMQLVRNLWLGHSRTLSRKAQEVALAWMLEHLTGLPKERLLEIYLNIIEWGDGVHGAAEAARYYFDEDCGRLTVPEALFLTTVVPAPTKWRYRFEPDGSLRPWERAQMHFIGRAMIAKGWLAADQLVGADSLRVELRGPARRVLFPADTLQAVGLRPAPRVAWGATSIGHAGRFPTEPR